MSKEICPVCGKKTLKKEETEGMGFVTLGSTFTFKEVNFVCHECEWAGDFSGETDKNYLSAQKKAQAQLVREIIADLKSLGITMSFFERIFELPVRTLTRWKNGDFSFVCLALLRIIKTYPWITRVAEHKFERQVAESAILQAGNNISIKKTKDGHQMQEPNNLTIIVFGQKPANQLVYQ